MSFGLQDHEVGGEADPPLGIEGRLVEIGDARLGRCAGIDGEVGAPDQPLIGAGGAEGMVLCEGSAFRDPELDEVRHGRTCLGVN